jgi:hypothetical protein
MTKLVRTLGGRILAAEDTPKEHECTSDSRPACAKCVYNPMIMQAIIRIKCTEEVV